MELYSEGDSYKLYSGNMLDLLEVIEIGTIDSIVTDPPYELNFMGKGWDNSGIAFQPDTWERCLEALKPGGYLLAFGGSRTYHRIACAIEDAGFEIRDCIMWLYGSGFPKSMNIEKSINKIDGVEFKSKPASGVGFMNTDNDGYHNTINQLEQVGESSERAKQRAGWGTALKPSYEPIIVARKPLEGSCTDNVIKYGVGGINIDECRVETQDNLNGGAYSKGEYDTSDNVYKLGLKRIEGQYEQPQGRFPANTILTYGDDDREEVCGGFPMRDKPNGSISKQYKMNNQVYGDYGYCNTREAYQDSGSAARYFYCAKASRRDRDEGLDGFEAKTKVFNGQSSKSSEDMKDVEKRFTTVGRNVHPTVKPTSLMQYLVRLVTPNGGTVLDPFNGSGSTGKAVMYENKDRNKNYKYIGIELTEEYLPIAKARIEYVINKEEEKSEGGLQQQRLF